MKLSKYKTKRDFKKTPEPSPKIKKGKSSELVFVIQEHHARRLHYDLRLEVDGVLKSWAVPKEPSLDPDIKRLAIMVEDHPYSYKDFEGVIPSGYGAGSVAIWDHGTYNVDGENAKNSEKAIKDGLKKGSIHFSLQGDKLNGVFYLVKIKTSEKNEWLLIKKKEKNRSVKKKNASLTNLDKFYWPKEKIAKGDMIRYYADVAEWMNLSE